MPRTLVLLAFLLVPSAITAQDLPPASQVARLADSLARDVVATGMLPSVAIGVVRGTDTFGAAFDPTLRLVFTLADGKATAMTLVQRGREVTGERKQ